MELHRSVTEFFWIRSLAKSGSKTVFFNTISDVYCKIDTVRQPCRDLQSSIVETKKGNAAYDQKTITAFISGPVHDRRLPGRLRERLLRTGFLQSTRGGSGDRKQQ